MKARNALRTFALVLGMALVAGQVLSGTCYYTITSGYVNISRPTSGSCYTPTTDISPSAYYEIDWQVTGSDDSGLCSAPVSWQQTGWTTDSAVGCNVSYDSTDWISNANFGSNGSFSRTRTWSCAATTLGNWVMKGQVKYGGTEIASQSKDYTVKLSCP